MVRSRRGGYLGGGSIIFIPASCEDVAIQKEVHQAEMSRQERLIAQSSIEHLSQDGVDRRRRCQSCGQLKVLASDSHVCAECSRQADFNGTTVSQILKTLSGVRFPLSEETKTQAAIAESFDRAGIIYEREDRLSPVDRIDFTIGSIGLEVKIKGSKRNIYNQVERYAQCDRIKELILVTNVPTGFPPEINGKPVYLLNLARAWM